MDQGAKHAEVETHWGRSGVINRIEAALREAGFDPGNMTPEILAPLDHLHTGGICVSDSHHVCRLDALLVTQVTVHPHHVANGQVIRGAIPENDVRQLLESTLSEGS